MHTIKLLILLLLLPAVVSAQSAQPSKPAPTKSATSGSDVSVLLVHGAWADGSSWDKIVPLLDAKGYRRIVAVHLPLTSTADDVAATQRAIEQQPGDVVLVGHSYGGTVISQAGNDAKVKALVYVNGWALDDGESINIVTKASPPAWLKSLQVDKGGFAWLPKDTVMKDFAQDLPPADQLLVTVKQGPVPTKLFDDAMKTPAWKTKPTWYVRGTADRIIDPALQDKMAKRMKARMTSVNASHVSMLSKPEDVSKVIVEAAASAKKTTARR